MKTLYLIGGPMGVGKTAACQALKRLVPASVFLDGDWCWDAFPFCVTEETKAMVLDNICHVLNNFLRCSAYQQVIFCWVLHEPAIWQDILARLDTAGCRVCQAALVCSPQALEARLQADIRAGQRQPDVLARSLARLPLYPALGVPLVDTTGLSPAQAAQRLAELAQQDAPDRTADIG